MSNNEIMVVDEKTLQDKIYVIRGSKVMLDSDLAEIYGYSTKAFNQQVKRNIDRFPEDFMFRLTKDEVSKNLRSQNVTLNIGAYSKYLPKKTISPDIEHVPIGLAVPASARERERIFRDSAFQLGAKLQQARLIGASDAVLIGGA